MKQNCNVNNICSICLEPIKIISKLNSCNHKFCQECIQNWEKRKKICPLCRTPFTHVINYDAQNFELINIGKNKENLKSFIPFNTCPKSHKLPSLEICSICRKYGKDSTIFTCQICQKYKVHYWCENTENFSLGIYICSLCIKLRNKRLNEI